MRKLLLLLVLAMSMVFVSCENEQDVRTELQTLQLSRDILKQNVRELTTIANVEKQHITALKTQTKELRIEKDMVRQGKEPMYVLKLKLKQSHMSLDPMKHIKDEANSIEFELPVSREFYDKVNIGTNIVDDFRVGSAIFSGSFGSWKMKVVDKNIR
jgi:hypothetical protein